MVEGGTSFEKENSSSFAKHSVVYVHDRAGRSGCLW